MDGEEKKYRYVHGVERLENINKLFRQVRMENKISVSKMADKVTFISKPSIRKFESTGYISMDKIIRCFDFLGYDLLVFAVKRDDENEPFVYGEEGE
jgi:hypothetical protein